MYTYTHKSIFTYAWYLIVKHKKNHFIINVHKSKGTYCHYYASILEVTVNTIRQEKQMGGIIIMKEEK